MSVPVSVGHGMILQLFLCIDPYIQATAATLIEKMRNSYFFSLFCSLLLGLSSGTLSAQQQIANGGFESGLSGWSKFIPAEAVGKNPSVTVVANGDPHSGSSVARLYADSPTRIGISTARLPVVPGERYRIGGWVKGDEGVQVQGGSAGVLARLVLLNAAGSDLPGGHYYIGFDQWLGRNLEPPANPLLPSEWTRIDAVVEIPAGAAEVVPGFFTWRAGDGAVYWDDVYFEKVPGSTPLTPISTTRSGFDPANVPPASAPAATQLLTQDRMDELFAALDLELPALSAVKTAVLADDYPQAVAAYAAYLRSRSGSHWLQPAFDPLQPDPTTTYNVLRAENARIGKVTPSDLAPLWHTFTGNIIDWYHNETLHNPVPYNKEWQWQLNRMSFWGDMAKAYRATANEAYPQAWEIQFRSFIAQCPPPAVVAEYEYSTWRTIEAGIRMRDSWPSAFQAFLNSASVSDEVLVLFAHSSMQHAKYLKQYPSDWGNWLTMGMCGLHSVGSLFPEFKDAQLWRQTAIETLRESALVQFLPDGAQYELSPGYHIVALDQNMMAIPRLALATGRLAEVPEDYVDMMEAGYDFLLYLMTPDRDMPRVNDSWPVSWLRTVMSNGLIFFPARDDWQWVVTDGAQGNPPVETSHAFPYAGYYVMRSGWETDANYVLFDGGPLGFAHSHQDKLNLVIWAYGQEVLFDGGGGSYEDSDWRRYGLLTQSHNTIMVDGMRQNRPHKDEATTVSRVPNDVEWESTPLYDFAAATYDGPYGTDPANNEHLATHTRRVLFAKPDVIVVADTLVPADALSHDYEARWHLLPTQIDVNNSLKSVTTTSVGKPNLAVVPLQTSGLVVEAISAQTTPEILGWNVRKDKSPQNVPATTVLHQRSGTGTQTFVTLLLPLRTGETNPVVSVTAVSANDYEVELTGGQTLSIHVPASPRGLITLEQE